MKFHFLFAVLLATVALIAGMVADGYAGGAVLADGEALATSGGGGCLAGTPVLEGNVFCCGDSMHIGIQNTALQPGFAVAWALSSSPIADSAQLADAITILPSEPLGGLGLAYGCGQWEAGLYQLTPFAVIDPWAELPLDTLVYAPDEGCQPDVLLCFDIVAETGWALDPLEIIFPDGEVLNVAEALAGVDLPLNQPLLNVFNGGDMPCLQMSDFYTGSPNGAWQIVASNVSGVEVRVDLLPGNLEVPAAGCNLLANGQAIPLPALETVLPAGGADSLRFDIPARQYELSPLFPQLDAACLSFGESAPLYFTNPITYQSVELECLAANQNYYAVHVSGVAGGLPELDASASYHFGEPASYFPDDGTYVFNAFIDQLPYQFSIGNAPSGACGAQAVYGGLDPCDFCEPPVLEFSSNCVNDGCFEVNVSLVEMGSSPYYAITDNMGSPETFLFNPSSISLGCYSIGEEVVIFVETDNMLCDVESGLMTETFCGDPICATAALLGNPLSANVCSGEAVEAAIDITPGIATAYSIDWLVNGESTGISDDTLHFAPEVGCSAQGYVLEAVLSCSLIGSEPLIIEAGTVTAYPSIVPDSVSVAATGNGCQTTVSYPPCPGFLINGLPQPVTFSAPPTVSEGTYTASIFTGGAFCNVENVEIPYQCALSSMSGMVFNDLDFNGIWEAGEPGIGGVAVLVFDSFGALQYVDITDAQGTYAFVGLPAGDYHIEFDFPDGYVTSPRDAGADDSVDSDVDSSGSTGLFAVGEGENITDVWAGLFAFSCAADAGGISPTPGGDGYFCAGEPISFNASGYNPAPDYGQLFLLARDVNLTIVDTSSTPEFDAPALDGKYCVFALNYSLAVPPQLPGIGQSMASIPFLDGCFDFDPSGCWEAVVLTPIAMTGTAFCNDSDQDNYYVLLNVTGGLPAFLNGGVYTLNVPPGEMVVAGAGGVGIAGPFANGTVSSITVTGDEAACMWEAELEFLFNCAPDCSSNAGVMPKDTVRVCEGSSVTLLSGGVSLASGDVLVYVLHDGPGEGLGMVYATNTTGIFSLEDVPQPAIVYYVSAVVGPDSDSNGFPDLSNACTRVAAGTPVMFLRELQLLQIAISDTSYSSFTLFATVSGGLTEAGETTYHVQVETDDGGFYEAQLAQSGGPVQIPVDFVGLETEYSVFAYELDGCGSSQQFSGIVSITVPVELLAFDGKTLPAGNELHWQTASEHNNSHFELHYSPNGIDFETLCQVPARGGGGGEGASYAYLHQSPPDGAGYYRLRQVDHDGSGKLLKTISLNRGKGEEGLAIDGLVCDYRGGNVISLQLQTGKARQTVGFALYDLSGKRVWSQNREVAAHEALSLHPSGVGGGLFLLAVEAGGGRVCKKIWLK